MITLDVNTISIFCPDFTVVVANTYGRYVTTWAEPSKPGVELEPLDFKESGMKVNVLPLILAPHVHFSAQIVWDCWGIPLRLHWRRCWEQLPFFVLHSEEKILILRWVMMMSLSSCSAKRGHREPKPIKHKEKVWNIWTKPSAVMWSGQVKQGLCSAEKDSPLETWESSSSWLLLERTPVLAMLCLAGLFCKYFHSSYEYD